MAETSAERGRTTRQRLLAAAVALIGEVGWNGVTTRMAAERAGVASGVVHYHFSSVNDLLIAASTDVVRNLLEGMTGQLQDQPDLDAGIGWLLGQVAAYSGDDPASLLIIEMYLASTRQPQLRSRLKELILQFRHAFAGWLRTRGYRGDAEATAIVLSAAIDGLILQRGLDPDLDLATLTAPLRAMFGRNDDR